MSPAFNLIDEPFIPCRTSAGTELRSLRDTLAHAHEIAEIADPDLPYTRGGEPPKRTP